MPPSRKIYNVRNGFNEALKYNNAAYARKVLKVDESLDLPAILPTESWTATEGATKQFSQQPRSSLLWIDAAGDLNVVNIKTPLAANIQDGQLMAISSEHDIADFNLTSDDVDVVIKNNPAFLVADDYYAWRWRAAKRIFVLVQSP